MLNNLPLRARALQSRVTPQTVAAAGILLLGFGLRLYRLDGQSLWYDEGTSVALAGRDLATITRSAAADIHPPLYYYLLHFWVYAFGTGEISVRSLSALLGTGVVGLTGWLGARLFDRRVGLVAMLFAAVSPFLVYYSQETRMYILVTLLGLLSFVLMVGPASPARRVAYVLVTAGALYSHYFAFTVVVAQNALVGLWLLRGGSRWPPNAESGAQHPARTWLAGWIAAQIATGLLYLPWLAMTWEQVQRWPAISQPFSPVFLLSEVLRVFPLGLSVPSDMTWQVVVLAAILGVGCLPVPLTRREQGKARGGGRYFGLLAAILYLAVPVATMYVLSLRRPLYNPKFLLLAVPAYAMLVARGVLAPLALAMPRFVRRRGGLDGGGITPVNRVALASLTLCLTAVVVAFSVDSLRHYYGDPRFARDDYRGIARYVEAAGRAGDAVVLNAPSQAEIFSYYYRGELPVVPLPQRRPADPRQTRSALADLAENHRRVFAVLWATNESDPDRIVEGWLNEHGFKAFDSWYGNVRLAMWALPPSSMSEVNHPMDVRFADEVTLTGYSLGDQAVAAGDVLPLTLFWQADQTPDRPYKVFVHLLDQRGQIVAQHDGEPVGGLRPTTSWQPGELIADRVGLLIPFGTPPGPTRLVAGLYDAQTGQRLIPASGPADGRVPVAMLDVTRPAVAPPVTALGLQNATDARFGTLGLLGYSLFKLGAEHDPSAPLHPGDTVHLVLAWQASEARPDDVKLRFSLVDSTGRLVAERITLPLDGAYPLAEWQSGEVVRDSQLLPLPGDLPVGRFRLGLEVQRARDGARLGSPLSLGEIQVE